MMKWRTSRRQSASFWCNDSLQKRHCCHQLNEGKNLVEQKGGKIFSPHTTFLWIQIFGVVSIIVELPLMGGDVCGIGCHLPWHWKAYVWCWWVMLWPLGCLFAWCVWQKGLCAALHCYFLLLCAVLHCQLPLFPEVVCSVFVDWRCDATSPWCMSSWILHVNERCRCNVQHTTFSSWLCVWHHHPWPTSLCIWKVCAAIWNVCAYSAASMGGAMCPPPLASRNWRWWQQHNSNNKIETNNNQPEQNI